MIHTVGPVWRGGGHGEAELLAACYRSAMALAATKAIESIAFPAISTGVYGFPIERAAPIAVREVAAALPSSTVQRVVFACFGADTEAHHRRALEALGGA